MIEVLLLIIVFQLGLSMYFYWFYQHKIHTKFDINEITDPVFETVRKKVKAFAKPGKRKPVVNDDYAAFKVEMDL